MRLLHLTDTHLGFHGHWLGAPAGWSRSDDFLAAFDAALAPALRGEVDAVVHTGDLFDRSQPPPAIAAAAGARLVEVARRVPTLVIPGNHDRRGLAAHLPRDAPGLTVLDEPGRWRVGDLVVAAVPWVQEADAWAVLAARAWNGGADLLATHMAFDGARVPGYAFRARRRPDTVAARHLPPGVRHVLCGHIHPRQAIRVGEAEVVMPGATERTATAEAGQPKGSALWTLDRAIRWRFVDGPARPLRAVRGPRDLDDLEPGTLVWLVGEGRTEELRDRALAAGGWVRRLRLRRSRQARLFSP